MTPPRSLEGKRVLVVEDEALIAMLTCDYLEELGCSITGPFANVEKALAAIEAEAVDLAVLDINLGNGRTSFPVAKALSERSTPFMFVTGYGIGGASEEFPDARVLAKPFSDAQLAKELAALLES
jgi:CheY-like chemotaxis protein